jgi:hypothetical protein
MIPDRPQQLGTISLFNEKLLREIVAEEVGRVVREELANGSRGLGGARTPTRCATSPRANRGASPRSRPTV